MVELYFQNGEFQLPGTNVITDLLVNAFGALLGFFRGIFIIQSFFASFENGYDEICSPFNF